MNIEQKTNMQELTEAEYTKVYAGTNTIGNMATTINKWAGVPFKDDGTVQTNIKDYRASLSKPKYGMPPKGAAGFNSGGIASLVV